MQHKRDSITFSSSLQNKRGFTLIELLVVMAILGILLTGLITAINPAEQIATSKDSNRGSAVVQLGKATHAYSIDQNQESNSFPLASNTWQDTLAQASEIGEAIGVDPNPNGSCNTNSQGNICYTTNGTNAIIWAISESTSSKKRAGGDCATAPISNFAAFVWIASKGRMGITCLGASATNIPAYNSTLN
jgi:prepilin-type N-terminal cleavage/methylation domain-containing protein